MGRHYPRLNPQHAKDANSFLRIFYQLFLPTLNRELDLMVDQIPAPSAFTGNEVVGGIIDGSNDTFYLANAPSPASSLLLFDIDGAGVTKLWVQGQPYDYSINANQVIFHAGSIPQSGHILVAFYRYLT